MTLWEVNVRPSDSQPDRAAQRLTAAAKEAGLTSNLQAATATGFLLEGEGLDSQSVEETCNQVLADRGVQTALHAKVGSQVLSATPARLATNSPVHLLHVLPKPGVMDPVALSTSAAVADLGINKPLVRTFRKYWLTGIEADVASEIGNRLLANDAIEQVVIGPLEVDHLDAGGAYHFELQTIPLAGLDDEALMRLSKAGQLYLQLAEMQTLQKFFSELGRDPTDIELETLAQTWSEHCSHKTLAGRIAYRDEKGERQFENMLKQTIFAATNELRERWGEADWCVSVFVDNAGIVRFDQQDNIAFKVETHNHPSALEPYGGANTGLGGVIRDTLGTGMGARPFASTDVFCFASPNTRASKIPPGVLHPRRVMQGVVEGVRDYGNRMGIPTVNGAVFFDARYLGNPLVYCGSAGILPRDMSFKKAQPGDLIVSIGGRTGRDGIHGATFSSAELTSESEDLSGGAVQIGNAIEEKRVQDVLLQARDEGLYSAVTDCGAGGFSSAVGEMGEEIGAEVWLEKCPLKYDGLSYTEIWISEAQERMVVSVPEKSWTRLEQLCSSEGVEATVIGKFVPTGRLVLKYHDQTVGDLPMEFMHDGRPPVIREATYTPPPAEPISLPQKSDYTAELLQILSSLNVASKEWIIRQYDHEVQGGSVVKPLVGVEEDGPGDAAVVRPKLTSRRGVVLSNGMNPRYGDLDTYDMAASAIDEAIRNAVAVGADPARIALLDNFCWGDCEKPETLGSLVRAAIACRDLSLVLETPFISGKDSLNNEFSYEDDQGERQTIAIPPSLLISAMGQVEDVAKCLTMDFKQSGNAIYLVGITKNELGGSHFAKVIGQTGGQVPTVEPEHAKRLFAILHQAIDAKTVRACHDLSEGGLCVALAEMAFAGGFGAQIALDDIPISGTLDVAERLFSESNTRFLCEVAPPDCEEFERLLATLPFGKLGEVTKEPKVEIYATGECCIEADVDALKQAWQSPLRW